MKLPFFYTDAAIGENEITLDQENSKHIVQVLRMRTDQSLHLTDGKGSLFSAIIKDDDKKACRVKIQSQSSKPQSRPKITIGISLIKNANRFEWFLEKATEIGVNEIIPLVCERTEKEKFRKERLNGILISAMLQSQQCWLPVLTEPVGLQELLRTEITQRKFIAHCENENAGNELSNYRAGEDSMILVGPEGDFSPGEIQSAIENNFLPVGLGNTRLRTETAGIVAATLLKL